MWKPFLFEILFHREMQDQKVISTVVQMRLELVSLYPYLRSFF